MKQSQTVSSNKALSEVVPVSVSSDRNGHTSNTDNPENSERANYYPTRRQSMEKVCAPKDLRDFYAVFSESGWFKVSKKILHYVSPNAAIIYAEMMDMYEYFLKTSDNPVNRQMLADGWFWLTYPTIDTHLGIKRRAAENAIKELINYELVSVDVVREGMLCKTKYRINPNKFMELLKREYVRGTISNVPDVQNIHPEEVPMDVQNIHPACTIHPSQMDVTSINQYGSVLDGINQDGIKSISESKRPDSDNTVTSFKDLPIKSKKVRTPSIVDTLWYYWCSKVVDSGLVTKSFNDSDRGKFLGRMKSTGTGALTYASLEELKECIDLFVASKPEQYRFGWFYQSHKRFLDQIRTKKNSKFATNVGINVQLPTEI